MAESRELNCNAPCMSEGEMLGKSVVAAIGQAIHMPKLEHKTFSGDPMDFYLFRNNFENNLEMKAPTAGMKLDFLMNQCKGKARDLIDHCSFLNPIDGFMRAKGLLFDHYGDPEIVTNAFVRKLMDVKQLKDDDMLGLEMFAQLLQKSLMVLNEINNLGELNTLDRIAELAAKLPEDLWKRWKGRAAAHKTKTGRRPYFVDFTEFVVSEAETQNSYLAQTFNAKRKAKKPGSNLESKGRGTYGSAYSTEARKFAPSKIDINWNCYYCSSDHHISQCQKFRERSFEARFEFFRAKGICFNCLNKGHIARNCPSNVNCTVNGCHQRKHHWLLHRNLEREEKLSSADYIRANASSCTSSVSRSETNCYRNIVPVIARANGKEVHTYAFLDNGSDSTFCDNGLIKELGVTGESKSIELRTLGHRPCRKDCLLVTFRIASLDYTDEIELENVLVLEDIFVSPNPPVSTERLQELPHLKDVPMPEADGCKVKVVIGVDVPYVHRVIESRWGKEATVFAQRGPLGWSVIGKGYSNDGKAVASANFLETDILLDREINKYWECDFQEESGDLSFPTSKEDREVLKLLQASVQYDQGHFVAPLPWREGVVLPPGSRVLAEKRLKSLERRLLKDEHLLQSYVAKMNEYIEEGHAVRVEESNKTTTGPEWYLCHHPVSTQNKPKVRIVFDAAAKHKGMCLNDALKSGPDLVTPLNTVLTRFRKERHALVSDVKAMFFQVKVMEKDTDALRFLFWPEGDLKKKPVCYKIVKQAFGLKSSPCIATYCLQETVRRFGHEFDKEISDVIYGSMYVDDCLTSVEDETVAISTRRQLTKLLKKGGFSLTKWVSTSHRVLKDVPMAERAESVKELNFQSSVQERVLGVVWTVENDEFTFRTSRVMLKGHTKRHILSALNSLFDPLGMLAPVTLTAKLMFKDLMSLGYGWDETIAEEIANEWENWFSGISDLECVTFPRCVKPEGFGKVVKYSLHHFSDASSAGYGVVSYVRMVGECGKIHCSFLCAKARVVPKNSESIPRLELVAAVLAVKADKWLQATLQYPNCKSVFWTDSSAVRRSICNSNRRFKTFVANRLSRIHKQSQPSQWRHVPSRDNAADDCSRGLSVKKFLSSSRWLIGPQFLWSDPKHWPASPETEETLPPEFEPIEFKQLAAIECKDVPPLQQLIDRYSDLHQLKVSVAWWLRFRHFLWRQGDVGKESLTVDELKLAESEIVKYVQYLSFGKLIDVLDLNQGDDRAIRRSGKEKGLKHVVSLNPILVDGHLRVGGRLDRAAIPFDSKHPKILPSNNNLTRMIIWHHHLKVGHAGLNHTCCSIREEYWIIRAKSIVRRELDKCIVCKKTNARRGQQIMAELPSARLQADSPPFHMTGVDFFGPFLVRRGRSEVKKYGCMFTCMTSRCVHLELAEDLSTDAFINALRRFIARRQNPFCLYSDNGTNFVGAYNVLKESIQRLDRQKIERFCLVKGIRWQFNTPTASNMGGAWEIMIRAIRRILNKVFYKLPTLHSDVLHTALIECENIINSRPLTPLSFEPGDATPLSPNHLLKVNPQVSLPPGLFDEKDAYSRRRWRQVQFVAEEFWRRWYKEYLPTLCVRSKWLQKKRNLSTGDIVIVVNESLPRGRWELGRVIHVYPDRHNVIRQVELKVERGIIKRPVNKLCLVQEADKE